MAFNSFTKSINRKKGLKIGIMFGPEASGLSNEDLSYSNSIIQIPTSKKFSSMNLSHSMTIICYEIFKLIYPNKFKKENKALKISSKKSITRFIKFLTKLLEDRKFFQPKEKKETMLLNINNLFYRFEPSDKELRVLASIIGSLNKKNRKA